eukprot:9403673-Pyramimonas_sp.AAC.1
MRTAASVRRLECAGLAWRLVTVERAGFVTLLRGAVRLKGSRYLRLVLCSDRWACVPGAVLVGKMNGTNSAGGPATLGYFLAVDGFRQVGGPQPVQP